MMERIDCLMNNQNYLRHMKKNDTAEADRRFCRHNMEHFLDVARIAYIMNLEEQAGISKEMIYAAALLHDIGRHEQYEHNIPHDTASAKIARKLLQESHFEETEIVQITAAILAHRSKENIFETKLAEILFRADKASRACFSCLARSECNWADEKKNLQIKY